MILKYRGIILQQLKLLAPPPSAIVDLVSVAAIN